MRRFEVTEEWDGSRLDRFVRALPPKLSFAVIQEMARKRRILVNGRKASGGSRLKEGDTVEIALQPAEAGGENPSGGGRGSISDAALKDLEMKWGSIGGSIRVLWEDSSILAINKPAGLVVQPGNRSGRGSLLDLLDRYSGKRDTAEDIPSFRYSPVHRLDRDTTGVLVVAKTRRASRALSAAFRRGEAEKRYLAILESVPSPAGGTITTPLRTRKGISSKSIADQSGKQARTTYRLKRRLPGGRSLVELAIGTGRTHQIRAHMASIGSPVAGDRIYGTGGRRAGRLLLHAWKISFLHPETGERVRITVPPPSEFIP